MFLLFLSSALSLAAHILLPLLLKWFGFYKELIENSPAARKVFNAANPKNVEEFRAVLPRVLEAALTETRMGRAKVVKIRAIGRLLSGRSVSAALWNHICCQPKAPEGLIMTQAVVNYSDLLAEAHVTPELED